MAGTLEHHHERRPVAQRELRGSSALGSAAVPIDPPATVKSSAPTITGRPSIVPDPATKASAEMADHL